MSLIKVTKLRIQRHREYLEIPALLGTDIIENVYPWDPNVEGLTTGSKIIFTTGRFVECKETVDEIYDLFKGLDPYMDSTRMWWEGKWDAARVDPYEQGMVVLDDNWLMIANKQTTDRPAPQPSGNPTDDLPGSPAWDAPDPDFLGSAYTGHIYTLTQGGWLNSYDVWAPEVTGSTNYRVLLIASDFAKTVDAPVLNANAWTTIQFSPTPMKAGDQFSVILDSINSGSSSLVTGGWTRGVDSNLGEPAASEWNRRNTGEIIRISKTDADLVDRGTELLGVIAGSTIQMADSLTPAESRTWHVDGAPVDRGTSVEYQVSDVATGPNGEPPVGQICTATIDIPVAQNTKYKELTGNWPGGNPTWATVQGVKRLGGVDQPGASNNAYGVRVNFQPAYVSPDWDPMAYTD